MNADNFIYLKNEFKNLINFFKRFAWNLLPYKFASKLASYTTRYYRIKHLLNNALVDDNDAKHILLLLDSNWTRDALIMSKLFKSNGHKVVSIFYDLSPLIKPDFFEKLSELPGCCDPIANAQRGPIVGEAPVANCQSAGCVRSHAVANSDPCARCCA